MGGSPRPSDKQLRGAVRVTLQDLQWAMSAVKPSAMREVAVDVPKVTSPPLRSGETLPSTFSWRKRGELRAVCSYFGLESKRQGAELENRGFPGPEK